MYRPLYCLAATPFTASGGVDTADAETHSARLAEANIEILVGGGGAGEGHVLGVDELAELCAAASRGAAGRVVVGAAPAESRTAAIMRRRVDAAISGGAEVVQVSQLDGGHGMKPTLAEQEDYFNEVLDGLTVPVMLAIQAFSGYAAPPSLIRTLCERFDTLVAINLLGTPQAYQVALTEAVPRRVAFNTTLTNLGQAAMLGATGYLSPEANIIPITCRSLVDMEGAPHPEGVRLASTVQRFSSVVSQWAPSSARWIKMASRLVGLPTGYGVLRPPYRLPADHEIEAMASGLRNLNLDELACLGG